MILLFMWVIERTSVIFYEVLVNSTTFVDVLYIPRVCDFTVDVSVYYDAMHDSQRLELIHSNIFGIWPIVFEGEQSASSPSLMEFILTNTQDLSSFFLR
jgi:hypothetical protein